MAQIYVRLPQIFTIISARNYCSQLSKRHRSLVARICKTSLSRVVAAFSPPNNIGVNIGEGLISIKDNRRTGIY